MHSDYFKDKKITVMGLGLLGRGIGDTAFLARCGADLLVTDLKTEQDLASSLALLKEFSNIKYTLGGHKEADFEGRDMILKAAGVPYDSIYIQRAKDNRIPVEMSASLVAKLSGATIVGVTGTRGKSTTTQLIYHILQKQERPVHLGGNVRGIATLPLLEKVHQGDIVVMELDSWQMQGFGESEISPEVAVFSTFYPDHMNYYHNDMQRYFDDKANIFKYQTSTNLLVASPQAAEEISRYYKEDIHSTYKIVEPIEIMNRALVGAHNKFNAACALEVAKYFGIEETEVQKSIEDFPGVEGRLQFVRSVNGVSIYNDNNATTPDATVAGLKALSHGKNIVLIVGGSDKGLDMSELVSEIPNHCKGVVLFKEKGTDRIRDEIFALEGLKVVECDTLSECVDEAMKLASGEGTVLYSPAFASFGKWFKNEYDRNDQFMELVQAL